MQSSGSFITYSIPLSIRVVLNTSWNCLGGISEEDLHCITSHHLIFHHLIRETIDLTAHSHTRQHIPTIARATLAATAHPHQSSSIASCAMGQLYWSSIGKSWARRRRGTPKAIPDCA
mmetsp:Transcript_26263/g.55441  ORF Transcript_26263/g.55441 Transcript_26263/m.55441 type:complete len:118 (+) Transcript_26263:408-761(+)